MAKVEIFLAHRDLEEEITGAEQFGIAEISLASDSPLLGKSLAEAKFREKHRVTVIGIRRGDQRLPSPKKEEILQAGDSLIVTGKAEVVNQLASGGPL